MLRNAVVPWGGGRGGGGGADYMAAAVVYVSPPTELPAPAPGVKSARADGAAAPRPAVVVTEAVSPVAGAPGVVPG
eukprot:66633-Chlamydomonas_euryale.AAC.1